MRLKAIQINPGDGNTVRRIQILPGTGNAGRAIIERKGSAPGATFRIRRESPDSDEAVKQLRKDVDALRVALKKLQGKESKKDDN